MPKSVQSKKASKLLLIEDKCFQADALAEAHSLLLLNAFNIFFFSDQFLTEKQLTPPELKDAQNNTHTINRLVWIGF
jgi:hypothetical protein